MFEVGQRVVCVDDKFQPIDKEIFPDLPKEGQIYRVRDVVPGLQHDMTQTCSILLREIVSSPNRHGFEPGFAPWRFRELDEIKVYEKKTEAQPKEKELVHV